MVVAVLGMNDRMVEFIICYYPSGSVVVSLVVNVLEVQPMSVRYGGWWWTLESISEVESRDQGYVVVIVIQQRRCSLLTPLSSRKQSCSSSGRYFPVI